MATTARYDTIADWYPGWVGDGPGLIAERVSREEAADGFILDGFPRTTGQAEALGAKMDELGRELTAAILIEVSDDQVVRRLSGRRTCVKGGLREPADCPRHPETKSEPACRPEPYWLRRSRRPCSR